MPSVSSWQPTASIPERWLPLKYHPMQSKLWRTRERNVKVCAGRGSGKTEISRRRVVRYLRVKKPWNDPRYFYAMPTYAQCRRVAREHILSLIPRQWFSKVPGDSQMEFKMIFGSWLFLVGLDKPARIEGDQYDGGVVDESSDQKAGVYARTIRPALTHREGWCWRIGVPKRHGPGAAEFRKAFDSGMLGVDSFTWPSWDILSAEEIAEIRKELDEKDYNEQIGGNWVAAGGAAYYSFSKANISEDAVYNPEKPIYVGQDFNVDPMAWVLAHRLENSTYHVFAEIWLRDTNTQRTLDVLWDRWGKNHKAGWVFVGDASSDNRHTSAATSDRAQLANDQRFKARMRYDDSNPYVKDRLAAVNAICKNAAQEHRLFINPACQHLLTDLETRALNDRGEPTPAVPGEAHDSGHATDALGYLIYKFNPVKYKTETTGLIVVGED